MTLRTGKDARQANAYAVAHAFAWPGHECLAVRGRVGLTSWD
ncbi:hypothetical protein ACQPZZ_37920 [Microbispora sp. CA-135349]